MQVSPHRLLIPLLISFSLTGAGLVLIYFLNKQQEEDERNKRKVEPGFTEIGIPRQFVPVIIGRGGTVIQNIQESTNTKISFKEESDVDLIQRTCIITGKPENIKLAEEKIKSILNNQPIVETYETWVPQQTIDKITEKGEEILNKIQNLSNAKIILEGSLRTTNLDTKKRVIIKGTAEQITEALLLIEDKVKEDNEARAKTDSSSLNRVPRVKSPSTATSPATPESIFKNVHSPKEIFGKQANDGIMEIFVCAMESPSQFYIQVVGPANASLDELTTEMTIYYESEENREVHTLNKISVGQMVTAKFSVDDKWYRAEIISDLGDNTYNVYFVDFGDQEKIDGKNIFELRTDFLSLRLQAIECSLAGVKPLDGEWSEGAIAVFGELCSVANWKPRFAKVRGYKERVLSCGTSRREGSPIPCVELYMKHDDQLVSIGKELIRLELASAENEPWSAASSTLSLSRRSLDTSRTRSSPEVSFLETTNGTVLPLTSDKPIEEIDLTLSPQPKKNGTKSTLNNVEVIDLTTSPSGPLEPAMKAPTVNFKYNERTMSNGSGKSYGRDRQYNPRKNNGNSSGSRKRLPANPFKKDQSTTVRNIMPAGYEEEEDDDDSDCLEYN